jgi:NAD(P)-dependent dehydrogenase (short-subunit alcohol dehydrogenase family)
MVASNNFSLINKVIIVTGASSGIGRASAISIAKAGASVILMGRNTNRLQQTKSELPSNTPSFIIEHDFSEGSIPELKLNNAIGLLGPVSGMIHSAGISNTLPVRMIDDIKFRQITDINVLSGILLAKWISKPSHFNVNGCSIVFLSSVMGLVGEVGKTLYSLSKGALLAGAKSMALELAPKKIRVNCICPGVVETPMTDNAIYSQSDEARNRVIGLHPLGIGSVDDIANAALFLLSDASRWITGISLPVDGGYTAR